MGWVLFSIVRDAERYEEFQERYQFFTELSEFVDLTMDSGGFHRAKDEIAYTSDYLYGALWLMETYSTWSLTFDFPTFRGHPFNECLEETVRTLNWLLDRRGGRTRGCKFLNICQGATFELALRWWDETKHGMRNGIEGIAYAVLGMPAHVMLKLMRQQIDDYYFDDVERIHMLGLGKPMEAIFYTIIKRMM